MGVEHATPGRPSAREPRATILGDSGVSRRLLDISRWIGHQTWLPHPLRWNICHLLCKPEGLGHASFEVPFHGARYRGDFADATDRAVFFFGATDRREQMLLEALCDRRGPQSVFLDIGAGTGEHTLFMATRAQEVHAFEPLQLLRDKLEKKIELNALGNVTVHPVGLADRDTIMPHGRTDEVPGDRANAVVATVEGDNWLANHGVTRIDIVRIAPDASSPAVLTGLSQSLRTARPIILLCCNPKMRAQLIDRGVIEKLLPPAYLTFALAGPSERYHLQPIAADWNGASILSARQTVLLLVPGEWASLVPHKGRPRVHGYY